MVFYFTIHPGDLMRTRILEGSRIMLVAAAHWDDRRKRFKVRRPPADHIGGLCLDSGGFTAARRWGRYPWMPAQYADWIRETSRDVPLDFCAIMDYACEPAVNRTELQTNRDRIKATIRNERACLDAAPDLPWLPVLQGDTLAERLFDLDLRRRIGQLPASYAGIGSVCGRGPHAAAEALLFYQQHLPGIRFHAFGLDVRTLDHPAAGAAVHSWDSYGWSWARGQKLVDRPPEYTQRPDETRSTFTHRLARLYFTRTVLPRIHRNAQLTLF